MLANMHFHSIYSDGSFWPKELVKRALSSSFELLAMTDHDTMQGIPEFLIACQEAQIQGIPGVEIDCSETMIFNSEPFRFNKEILAYFPYHIEKEQWKTTKIYSLLEKKRLDRLQIMKKYLEKAQDVFNDTSINYENLIRFKLGSNQSENENIKFSWLKSDLYQFLLKNKNLNYENLQKTAQKAGEIVSKLSDPYEYFKKIYFIPEKLGDFKSEKFQLTELLNLIQKDGGIAVLPHPGHQYKDKFDAFQKNLEVFRLFITYCKQQGLKGIEFYYYKRNLSDDFKINQLVETLAQDYDLLLTYGSDFHRQGDMFEDFQHHFIGFPQIK